LNTGGSVRSAVAYQLRRSPGAICCAIAMPRSRWSVAEVKLVRAS